MAKRYLGWADAAAHFEQLGEGYVLVTVLNVKGSSPRDVGTKMLVTEAEAIASIGGGQLEFNAIDKARHLLAKGSNNQCVEEFPLGPKLGQCCGGKVTLLFECFASTAHQVAVFGAGHVARALITILAQLPVRVIWADSRPNEFPEQIPANVTQHLTDDLESVVTDLPRHCHVIVMTHNHPLDYAIMEAALKRNDCAYIGVIGSNTKAQRFRMRLAYWGFSETTIEQLHCPIGHPDITGKHPMEVALSIAAQLNQRFHEITPTHSPAQERGPIQEFPSLSWDGLTKRLDGTPNE